MSDERSIFGDVVAKARARAQKNAETAAARWAEIPEDADPASVKSAFEAMKAGTLKSSKELDDFKRALEEKTKGEMSKVGEKLTKREAQLRRLMVDQALTAELTAAGFGRTLRVMLPLCRESCSIEETNGELTVVLKDEHGRPLISKKAGNNDAMTITEFVSGLREQAEYKPLCEAKAAGGTGGASQTGGSGRAGDTHGREMSARELLEQGHSAT